MITYIVPYRDCLNNERQEFVIPFLTNMQKLMESNALCLTILCDYGSQDNIENVIKDFNRIVYLHVEPSREGFLNYSKCLNKAVSITQNPLIAPVGIDYFFNTDAIDYTIQFFKALGKIILRPELIYYDKDGKIYNRTNVPYVIHKDNIITAGGWDERMYDWGKEDDDLIFRVRRRDLIEISIKGFGYAHMWHSRDFSKKEELYQGHNFDIFKDNIKYNGKNILNSYWYEENGELKMI